jgi:hypothetical protein
VEGNLKELHRGEIERLRPKFNWMSPAREHLGRT